MFFICHTKIRKLPESETTIFRVRLKNQENEGLDSRFHWGKF